MEVNCTLWCGPPAPLMDQGVFPQRLCRDKLRQCWWSHLKVNGSKWSGPPAPLGAQGVFLHRICRDELGQFLGRRVCVRAIGCKRSRNFAMGESKLCDGLRPISSPGFGSVHLRLRLEPMAFRIRRWKSVQGYFTNDLAQTMFHDDSTMCP